MASVCVVSGLFRTHPAQRAPQENTPTPRGSFKKQTCERGWSVPCERKGKVSISPVLEGHQGYAAIWVCAMLLAIPVSDILLFLVLGFFRVGELEN